MVHLRPFLDPAFGDPYRPKGIATKVVENRSRKQFYHLPLKTFTPIGVIVAEISRAIQKIQTHQM